LLSLSGVERLLDYPPREARAAMGNGATRGSTDRLHAGLLALLVVGTYDRPKARLVVTRRYLRIYRIEIE
jgi:hypothetical protein